MILNAVHVASVAMALFCGAAAGAPPTEARRAELVHLVRQDCGSCHGLTLKGGLGPALVPQAMAERDDEQMQHVILYGRPGSAMPPWRDFLTPEEARWIVEQLKKGFPNAR